MLLTFIYQIYLTIRQLAMRPLALVLLLALTNCVSVNLPAPSNKKARVNFKPPSSPFEKVDVGGTSDTVWRNTRNGNNISYFTQCDDKADPELETIRNEMALGLLEYQVLSNARFPYNGREALKSQIKGKVDGVDTQMEIVIFKRNNCIYTLSLVGRANKTHEDAKEFAQFVEGFQAP